MAVDWFNLYATGATVYNLACLQLLWGFIVSYYIVEETDIYSYATTIDQSSDDDLKLRYFFLGAFLSTVPAAYMAKHLGIRWTILVTTMAFAGLLPIVSVVQQSNNEAFLFLLTLSGMLFGFVQIAIIQGACVCEVIGQFCRMGSFFCFKEVCTLLGLLAGTSLASSVGHPGAFPSLHTFSISLAVVILSSLLAFGSMYNLVQEMGIRERISAWSGRRESMRTSLLLLQENDEFSGKSGVLGGVGGGGFGGGRLLHAPLGDSDGSVHGSRGGDSVGGGNGSFRSNRSNSVGGGNGSRCGGVTCPALGDLWVDLGWAWNQLSRPEVRALLAITFVATFAVDILEYWSFSYFQDALGATGDTRQWGVLSVRVSLCVGFAASDLARPVFAMRQGRVVRACAAGAALGMLLFLCAAAAVAGAGGANTGTSTSTTVAVTLATTGSALIGLSLAPLLPMCISVAFTLPDMTPGVGVAVLLGVGYLTHMLASTLVGALATAAGVSAAMMLMLCVLLVAPLGGSLPTALCLVIDMDAFQIPIPDGVAFAGENHDRGSHGWA